VTGARRIALIGCVALALSPGLAGAASVLFDNGADLQVDTPTSGIDPLDQVSDDFALGSPASLTSVSFGENTVSAIRENSVAPVPLSVQWSIGTTPFSGNVASGTAPVNATFEGQVAGTTRVWNFSSSFALPGLALGAGTYWLTLGNGTDTGLLQEPAWSTSDATAGNAETLPAGSSASALGYEMAFQIFGTASVPEPASLGLVALGPAALALARRRR